VLQLAPAAMPELAGDLSAPAGETPYGLDRLLASVQSLPRQRALAARHDAARARVALERANRYPDVTVGLNVGREGPADARERVTTLSVSVPLPLFQRNDAALGQAVTEATQAEIERTVAIATTHRRRCGDSGVDWTASANACSACRGRWYRLPSTTSSSQRSLARRGKSACSISCSSIARRSMPRAT